MGGSISSLFGITEEEQPSQDYLQLTDLGGFLAKYIFIMLDKDKTKRVPKHEYLTLVNHFRERKTTEEELDEFLSKNVDGDEPIEYIDEKLFKKLILQLAIDFEENVSDRMKYLMTLFDKDQDGFVSESDLVGVYDAIGIQVPTEPIRCLVRKYDKDGDGKLNAEEFENLGRSAMNKLFKKREPPKIEDALVEEALLKGSVSLMSMSSNEEDAGAGERKTRSKPSKSLYSHIDEIEKRIKGLQRDINNNITEEAVFGKPVELTDSSTTSSLVPTPSEGSEGEAPKPRRLPVPVGKSGSKMRSLKGLLKELELEDVED